MYHHENLGTGLYQLCLDQHTTEIRKNVKDRVDQHQVTYGGGGYGAIMTAPNGIALPKTLPMVHSFHAHLRVMLKNLLG